MLIIFKLLPIHYIIFAMVTQSNYAALCCYTVVSVAAITNLILSPVSGCFRSKLSTDSLHPCMCSCGECLSRRLFLLFPIDGGHADRLLYPEAADCQFLAHVQSMHAKSNRLKVWSTSAWDAPNDEIHATCTIQTITDCGQLKCELR